MRKVRENDRLVAERFRVVAVAAALTLGVAAGGCSKKSRPVPLPPPVTSTSTAAESSPREVDPTAPPPQLEIFLEPRVVGPGEPAILSWESQNADRVVIAPDIGPVIASGRIKLFPDATLTYQVTAEGPGGALTKTATVEVAGVDNPRVWDDEVESTSLEERFNTSVKPIFFDFDSAELNESARITLDGNIRWLSRPDNRDVRFLIEGHCDQRGSEEYNFALGDKRSQTVRSYIVSGGIDPSRVSSVSLGEERPFAGGTSEADYALNRRAQFVLLSNDR